LNLIHKKNKNEENKFNNWFLAIVISGYNVFSGEPIQSNLVGFILGVGFVLNYLKLKIQIN